MVGQPFLTIYTPTFRRPQQLRACMESVGSQSSLHDIQHLIIPDYIGIGIDGMYARVAEAVPMVKGEYVHFLADDDILAAPNVVADVKAFARAHDHPPLILVRALKGTSEWPIGNIWPPVEGQIDLGCAITRADIWKAHAKDYGQRYEGDYDFLHALYQAGVHPRVLDLRFSIGAVSHGYPEVAA